MLIKSQVEIFTNNLVYSGLLSPQQQDAAILLSFNSFKELCSFLSFNYKIDFSYLDFSILDTEPSSYLSDDYYLVNELNLLREQLC